MNIKQYLELSPSKLLEILTDTFIYDVPEQLNTVEELSSASKMLSETTNHYTFLVQLYSYAKINVRELKRRGSSYKVEYENAIDKKDVIKNILDAILLRYKTLSRMITIKQEINNEMKMSSN